MSWLKSDLIVNIFVENQEPILNYLSWTVSQFKNKSKTVLSISTVE